MKLSLTAIAALFAVTLHPTLATGTRAASSNSNNNAAEAKPDRDLGLMQDLGLAETPFDKFDEAIDAIVGDLVENKLAVAQSQALVKFALVQNLSGCILTMLGQNFGNSRSINPVHLGGLVGMEGMGLEWFGHLAGTDDMIHAIELNKTFILWQMSDLQSLFKVMSSSGYC